MVNYIYEQRFWKKGIEYVAGVDEAGRGPLAGPVVAAAVMFRPGDWIDGVDDSKKLSPSQREVMFQLIRERALGIGIASVSHTVIDKVNILKATMRAMAQAVSKLHPSPRHLLVDGPRYDTKTIPYTPIVDGDAKCFSIAAASIVAKVTRDRLMAEFDKKFPQYGFAQHKGYATQEHRDAILRFGPCEIHRRSFRMPNVVNINDP